MSRLLPDKAVVGVQRFLRCVQIPGQRPVGVSLPQRPRGVAGKAAGGVHHVHRQTALLLPALGASAALFQELLRVLPVTRGEQFHDGDQNGGDPANDLSPHEHHPPRFPWLRTAAPPERSPSLLPGSGRTASE